MSTAKDYLILDKLSDLPHEVTVSEVSISRGIIPGQYISTFDAPSIGTRFTVSVYVPEKWQAFASQPHMEAWLFEIMRVASICDSAYEVLMRSPSDVVRLKYTSKSMDATIELVNQFFDILIDSVGTTSPWLPQWVEFTNEQQSPILETPVELRNLEVNLKNYLVGASGGKDSFIANQIMGKLGYNPVKTCIQLSPHPELNIPLVQWHFGFRPIDDQHQELYNRVVAKARTYKEKTRKKVQHDIHNPSMAVSMLPLWAYAVENEALPHLLVFGDPWGSSKSWNTTGGVVHDLAFYEGLAHKRLFEPYYKKVLGHIPSHVSPIACLNEVAIMDIVHSVYGWKWKDYRSCWWAEEYHDVSEHYRSCESCQKCLRMKVADFYLAKHRKYPFDILQGMMDKRPNSVPKISPSTWTWSIQSGSLYENLISRRKLDPSDDMAITAAYTSPEIIEYMGGEYLSKKIFDLLDLDYNRIVVNEPETPFDLRLRPIVDMVPDILSALGTKDNPWEEINQRIVDIQSNGGDYSVSVLPWFELPFEEYLDQAYPWVGCLYRHYTEWVFYDDAKGDAEWHDWPLKVVKLEYAEGTEHKRPSVRNSRTPEFPTMLVRNSLRWGDDKVSLLQDLLTEGVITGYSISTEEVHG